MWLALKLGEDLSACTIYLPNPEDFPQNLLNTKSPNLITISDSTEEALWSTKVCREE